MEILGALQIILEFQPKYYKLFQKHTLAGLHVETPSFKMHIMHWIWMVWSFSFLFYIFYLLRSEKCPRCAKASWFAIHLSWWLWLMRMMMINVKLEIEGDFRVSNPNQISQETGKQAAQASNFVKTSKHGIMILVHMISSIASVCIKLVPHFTNKIILAHRMSSQLPWLATCIIIIITIIPSETGEVGEYAHCISFMSYFGHECLSFH